jgi:type I restriction enzyme S subunit
MYPLVRLTEVLTHRKTFITIDDTQTYMRCRVQSYGKGVVLRDIVAGADIKTKQQQVCRAGEFLVAEIDAKVGGFGIVPPDLDGAVVSSHYFLFTLDETQIDQRYLKYYVRTPEFQDQVTAQGSTNYAAIRPQHVLEYVIPLPPLDEQQRIVAHIDVLAEQITAARGLRQCAVEEAEALLNAVKNDVFSDEYVASFPSILLGDVSDIRSGVTLGRKLVGDTISLPYLRVANVQDGYLDLAEVKEVEVLASEFDKWQLQFGDILLTEGGDWDKLGRGTVWQDEIPNCIHQNHIFRVRVDLEAFNPHFLMGLISSPRGKRYFQDASKQTTNLASINQRQLKAFQVFCPPLEEQRIIVEEIEEVGRQVAYFKRLQADTTVELDALLPSLLDRAFRGEL